MKTSNTLTIWGHVDFENNYLPNNLKKLREGGYDHLYVVYYDEPRVEYYLEMFLKNECKVPTTILTNRDCNLFYFYKIFNYNLFHNIKSSPVANPKTKFFYLAGTTRQRLFKCYLMEELAKRNILKDIKYSWTDTRCSYDGQRKTFRFKYFDNRINTFGENEIANGYLIHKALRFPYKKVSDCLFNIIVEESKEYIFFSEKTVDAFYHQRPLLPLSSAVGFIDKLKSLGFDLNENIIDFSYDYEDDLEKKVIMFVDQIEKINSYDIKKLNSLTKASRIHNYKLFLEIMKTRPTYESNLKSLLNMYKYPYVLGKWFDRHDET